MKQALKTVGFDGCVQKHGLTKCLSNLNEIVNESVLKAIGPIYSKKTGDTTAREVKIRTLILESGLEKCREKFGRKPCIRSLLTLSNESLDLVGDILFIDKGPENEPGLVIKNQKVKKCIPDDSDCPSKHQASTYFNSDWKNKQHNNYLFV